MYALLQGRGGAYYKKEFCVPVNKLMLSVKDFKSTRKHCFSKQYDTLTIIALAITCKQAQTRRV